MVFDEYDYEILRLCGFCRYLPTGLARRFNSPCFRVAVIYTLMHNRYIKMQSDNSSYKLTSVGKGALADMGYVYPQDSRMNIRQKQYSRKLNNALWNILLHLAGIDIFAEDTAKLAGTDVGYVSSLMLRTDVNIRVLAGTRFLGILKVYDTAYIPYFIEGENDWLIPKYEAEIYRSQISMLKTVKDIKVIITGSHLEELWRYLHPLNESTIEGKGMKRIDEALEELASDYLLVPTNDSGVMQMRLVSIRGYRERIAKADFWDKAEQNLLIALILYVQSMRDPITNELLPLHERSLGTIYKILSSESAKSLDMKFQKLPLDHPARGPYGIFKQAASNLWGNVFIGLGSRMNVFQNKLVDKITKYHDIDLELPGKQPCAYFCIISAQDTAYEFLSSMFFSMLFKKLSDYARKHGDERGRLPVEVNFIMDEFCNIGKLLDFKKTISVVRGYGINCQIVVQSIAQLSDRYPVKEWEEIVGNCDTQLVLGCNDMMTSDYISKRCGSITIQLTTGMAPQTPLFSPITREVTGYRQTKMNQTRPLMYPEEILQMDNRECLLLIRGQKPLKGYKIIPDELSSYKDLKYRRVSDYIPQWRELDEAEQKAPDIQTSWQQGIDYNREAATPAFGTGAEEQETIEDTQEVVHAPEQKKTKLFSSVAAYDTKTGEDYEITNPDDIANE